MIGWEEIFVLGITHILFLAFIFFYREKLWKDKRIAWQSLGLWIYHLFFTIFFFQYIQDEGGDAIRYWAITADTSQYANSWMGHFGFSTFFIQWINYLPSKILGLSFFSGNVFYGFLSFWAFFYFLKIIAYYFPIEKKGHWTNWLPFLILWFPGIHFWTAGVGKETFVILGSAGLWWYSLNLPKRWVELGLFWILLLLVKPLVGLLFIFPLGWIVWTQLDWTWLRKLSILVFLLLSCIYPLSWLLQYSHLDSISISELTEFSRSQFEFLESFGANSQIPMLEYNFFEKVITIWFRPFIWESWNFYSFLFSLENSLILFLTLCAGFVFFQGQNQKLRTVAPYLAIFIGMSLVFSFTLNNFGLIYRMKSVWLPFLYISLVWLIWPFIGRLKRRMR